MEIVGQNIYDIHNRLLYSLLPSATPYGRLSSPKSPRKTEFSEYSQQERASARRTPSGTPKY